MTREPTPEEQARSDRMDWHMLSALGGPDSQVSVITALYDALNFQLRRAFLLASARKKDEPYP